MILLGPNGVGKSHVGRVLAENFVCSFLSIEEFFMRGYSSQCAFRADESNAYARLGVRLEDTLAQTQTTVVLEQCGLSAVEHHLIGTLQSGHRVVLVEIMASLETALKRVADRGTGSNFSKTPESVRRVWELYLAQARPQYSFKASVFNEGLTHEEICRYFDDIEGFRRSMHR